MSITLIIIILTVIASFYAWSNPQVQHKWIFSPYIVHTNNEYHRFVTSGFIHADQMHLFFNMFTLFFFGELIENVYQHYFGSLGLALFVLLYIAGIVISDIPTFIKHKADPGYRALGASGGVAAVVFSSIMFFPLNKIYIFGIIGIPGFILGVLYIIYSYFQGKKMADNINHDAHLYGAAFGIVFSIIIDPGVIARFVDQVLSYRAF